MALWKTRSLSIEQKVQLVEDDPETKSFVNEENASFLGLDDVSMSEVHSCALPVPVNSLSLSLCLQIIGCIFYFLYYFTNICVIIVIIIFFNYSRSVSLWSYSMGVSWTAESWKNLVVLVILTPLGYLKTTMSMKGPYITNLKSVFHAIKSK